MMMMTTNYDYDDDDNDDSGPETLEHPTAYAHIDYQNNDGD